MKTNIIKSIPDFENYTIDIWGNVFNKKTRKYLKYNRNKNYPRVHLTNKNKRKGVAIHILLATLFLENIENKPVVNHIDNNPKNFGLYNLEWATYSENAIHAVKYKKTIKGQNNIHAKLTPTKVLTIFYAEGSHQKIANHFNISKSLVTRIKNKTMWTYLLNDINNKIKFKKLKVKDLKNNKKEKIRDEDRGFEKKIIKNAIKYTIDIGGNVMNIKAGKYLIPHVNKKGYLSVILNYKRKYIHRLVAEAFLPNPENKKHVDHINEIKSDNNLSNLRWATPAENLGYAKKHILDESEVFKIFNAEGSHRKIADIYGVSRATVNRIKNNKYNGLL